MGVALFVSPIFWYLSFSVSAFNPWETQKCYLIQLSVRNMLLANMPGKVKDASIKPAREGSL